MDNTNVVIVTGNLTRDPEPRGGGKVAALRLAVNGSRKDGGGNWVDDPNYFDAALFGKNAENAIKYLTKGREVLIEGRLDWREWEAADGSKRQGVQIIAKRVEYLRGGEKKPGAGSTDPIPEYEPPSNELAGVGAGGASEDDIPF